MKINHFYKAFGLNIASDLPISSFDKGEMSDHIDLYIQKLPIEADPSSLLILIKNDNFDLYFHENRLFYAIKKTTAIAVVINYIMVLGVNYFLFKRGFLPIHGSSIVLNETEGILILGESGAGKSTTVGLFLKKGYKILGDDIAVIAVDEHKKPLLYPSYPEIGLWSKSMELLSNEAFEKHKKERIGLSGKYDCNISTAFFRKTIPLKAVFLLEKSTEQGQQPTQQIENTLQKMQILREHCFYYNSMVEKQGFLTDFFYKSSYLARQVPFYRLNRMESSQLFPTSDYILSTINT